MTSSSSLSLPPSAFGDEKLTDEIIAKIAAPRASEAAHIIGESARRLGRAILDGAHHAELVHRDHAMRPVDELTPHVARNAEQVGDHGDRNGASEFGDEIGRALGHERVDPLMRQSLDLRSELFDPARDEGAVDEVAQPCVLRRLELQHRMALERVERLKMRSSTGGQPSASRLITAGSSGRSGGRAEAPRRRQAREAPEAVVLPEERRRRVADRRDRPDRDRSKKSGSRGSRRTRRRASVDDRSSWARALAERIGRLNDIGSAARSVAGRIEDEALGGERSRQQRSARGEIVRDRRLSRRRAAGPASHAAYICGSRAQRRCASSAAPVRPADSISAALRLHLGDDRARLVAAEPAQSLEANRRLRPADVAQRLGDVARGARVDVADESKRDVVVLGLEPARADNAAARERKLANDGAPAVRAR